PKCRVLALLDTLRYIEMGGRVSRAQAMIGTMLDLKPLLLVADREIKSVDRVRTRSRAIPRMVEFFRTEMPVETLAVMHAQAPDAEDGRRDGEESRDGDREQAEALFLPLAPGQPIVPAQGGW